MGDTILARRPRCVISFLAIASFIPSTRGTRTYRVLAAQLETMPSITTAATATTEHPRPLAVQRWPTIVITTPRQT